MGWRYQLFRVSKIKKHLLKIFAYSQLCLVLGCSIIDVRELQIVTNPTGHDSILESQDVISVTFSRPIKKSQAENIIKVNEFISDASVTIDYEWQSSTTVFLRTPDNLKSGLRYLLSVFGSVETENGGMYQVRASVPFFASHRNGPFQLLSNSPEQDQTVGLWDNLLFTFSTAQDTQEFEREFSLSPNLDLAFTWSNNNQTVTVAPQAPDRPWVHLTRYTWTVPNTLKDANNTTILRTYTGNFLVQEDLSPPELTQVLTAQYNKMNGTYFIGSISLNDLEFSDSILLRFSEAIDEQSLRTALSITPSIDATLLQHDETNWLYVPESGWDQSTTYTLELSTQLRDLAGNNLLEDYRTQFIPAIRPVEFASIEGSSNAQGASVFITEYDSDIPIDIIPETLDGKYRITLRMEEGSFPTFEEKERFVRSIAFQGFLPPIGDPPLTNITWLDDQTLSLVYTDLTRGESDPWNQQLYRLLIRGGTSSRNNLGQYLEKDVYVIFRTR